MLYFILVPLLIIGFYIWTRSIFSDDLSAVESFQSTETFEGAAQETPQGEISKKSKKKISSLNF